MALAAVSVVFALRVRADFTPEEMFSGDAAARARAADFRRNFGNTDNVLLILIEAPDVTAPPVLAYLRDLSTDVAALPWAAEVESPTAVSLPRRSGPPRDATKPIDPTTVATDLATGRLDLSPIIGPGPVTEARAAELRSALADAPLVEGTLISRDRSVAMVAALIRADRQKVDDLEPAVEDLEGLLARHPPPPGTAAHLSGLPYIRVDVIRSLESDQKILFPGAFVVILLLLFVSFRWLPAVVVPVIVVGVSADLLMGAMGASGESLNIINNIVPILVIIIGISDSIHFVNRYGEALVEEPDRRSAARTALGGMVVALFLTSFTTAVGFGSLAVSKLPALVRFGVTAACGVLIAYVVTIAVLPGALSLMPRPRRPLADHQRGYVERLVGPLTDVVLRHRLLVLLVSAAVAVVCSVAASGVRADTAVHHQYDTHSRAYRGLQLLETKLDGVRPVEVALRAGPGRMSDPDVLDAMDRVSQWARGRKEVLSATSYADLLHAVWFAVTGDARARTLPIADPARAHTLAALFDSAPRGMGRFVTDDHASARISLQLADVGGRATLAFVNLLRQRLSKELPADVRWDLAGEGYTSSAGLTVLTRDLISSMLMAVVVIFGFMTLILRSPRLGLISVPPNLLPLVATIAYLRVRDIPLSPATAIIFTISLGLAVDGTIHVLARFREEIATGAGRDEALRQAARATGKAVVVSYLSLIIGFTVFLLSSFVPVREFGELVAVTISGCLVSTLVVLPALLSVAWPRDRQARR